MARALPGSRANCPSGVSQACGPGYRFVPWAGTGPRRASSERLAVGEGSAHRTGTRLGAGGRAGAGGRVQQGPGKARPGQGAAGGASRRGHRSMPPPSPTPPRCAPPPQGPGPGAPGRRLPPSPGSRRFQAAGQSTQGPFQPAPGLPQGLNGPQPLALPTSHYVPAPPRFPSPTCRNQTRGWACQGHRDPLLPSCGG